MAHSVAWWTMVIRGGLVAQSVAWWTMVICSTLVDRSVAWCTMVIHIVLMTSSHVYDTFLMTNRCTHLSDDVITCVEIQWFHGYRCVKITIFVWSWCHDV